MTKVVERARKEAGAAEKFLAVGPASVPPLPAAEAVAGRIDRRQTARTARSTPSRVDNSGTSVNACRRSCADADAGDRSPPPPTRRRASLGARGEIAQLVEHTTENRGVPGSSPGLAIADDWC